MSATIVISEQTADHLANLPLVGQDADSKVRALLEAEYRHQLARYALTDRQLRDKYQMTQEEFERQRLVEQRGFTWEVEADASEWELAVSGARTIRRKLTELLGKTLDDLA
jgi:hypothetical protein